MQKLCESCNKYYEARDKRYKTCSWECRNKRISKLYKGRVFTQEHKDNIKKNHHDVSGSKNPRWIGGIRSNGHGYLWVYSPNHKYNSQNYVLQHRLVMEKHIGRFLRPEEVVHHLNGKKDDNRIENLQLLKGLQEHGFIHQDKRVQTAITFVECEFCQTKFGKTNSQIHATKHNFCSRKCFFESIKV